MLVKLLHVCMCCVRTCTTQIDDTFTVENYSVANAETKASTLTPCCRIDDELANYLKSLNS
jgi:hypothetical protein